MNLKQFFSALHKTGWRLADGIYVRRRKADGCDHCPISAVVQRISKSPTDSNHINFDIAKDKIGLTNKDASDIMKAADWVNFRSPRLRRLRRRLLKHCGLRGGIIA